MPPTFPIELLCLHVPSFELSSALSPLAGWSTSTGVAPPGGWRRCRCLLASGCTLETQLECWVRAPPKVAPYGGCQRMSHSAHALYLLACLLVYSCLRCTALLACPAAACRRCARPQTRAQNAFWLKLWPVAPHLRRCIPSTLPLALLHRGVDAAIAPGRKTGRCTVAAAHTFHVQYAYSPSILDSNLVLGNCTRSAGSRTLSTVIQLQ